MKLYGFGSRGVAIRPINPPVPDDDPIPLFRTREEVQDEIDKINAERGIGSLHVIEFEGGGPRLTLEQIRACENAVSYAGYPYFRAQGPEFVAELLGTLREMRREAEADA